MHEELKKQAYEARKIFLTIAAKTGALHIGSSLSHIDLLTALYSDFLNVSPENSKDLKRDIFVLSKGHAALGYYVILAQKGFIPLIDVEKYGQDNTYLAAHPVYGSAPGLEVTTGSLGHGLPIALGMAIVAKRLGWSSKYVVLLSDGEIDEGSNWEAILLAGHLKLDNLTVIVDYNKIQSFGTVKEVLDLEPFVDKWKAFNWFVQEIDGHKFEEIIPAFDIIKNNKNNKNNKPNVIIANTIKGKGVPYMENKLEWHYLNIKLDALDDTIKQLY